MKYEMLRNLQGKRVCVIRKVVDKVFFYTGRIELVGTSFLYMIEDRQGSTYFNIQDITEIKNIEDIQ